MAQGSAIPLDAFRQPPPVVGTLPSSPYDGEEVYYQADLANGIIWHLKYLAGVSGSYKWVYLGGAPLRGEVQTAEGTSSLSYTNLGTTGPSVTVPLAGDYDIEISCSAWSNTSGQAFYISYAIGGTAADNADGVFIQEASGGNTRPTTERSSRRKTGIAAATALVAKYKVNGGTATYQHRRMVVTPVRVG